MGASVALSSTSVDTCEDMDVTEDMEDIELMADKSHSYMSPEMANLRAKYNIGQNSNLTPDQRKQAMQNYQTDFQTWLKSQGIDPNILKFGIGNGMMRGRGMMGGWKQGNN